MANRPVTHVRHDRQGVITHIGNPGQPWSPRLEADAIRDIETGAHSYYVPWTTGSTWVRVVQGTYRKYLRTDRDNTTRNNLDDLPEC